MPKSVPEPYLAYISACGPFEGYLETQGGKRDIILWDLQEIEFAAEVLAFDLALADVLAFGTDGKGTLFAFDKEDAVVTLMMKSRTPAVATRIAASFEDLARAFRTCFGCR